MSNTLVNADSRQRRFAPLSPAGYLGRWASLTLF